MSTLRTNKFRDKLKQFTAIALAGILSISSLSLQPLTVHAEDTGVQNSADQDLKKCRGRQTGVFAL